MSLNRFFMEYPRFKRYSTTPGISDMYEFMSTPESIEKMLTANDTFGMPALAGINNELQTKFHSHVLDFCNNEVRQLIGCMVKEIIQDFGYETNKQKGLRGSNIISSATHYKKNPVKATKVLKRILVIEDI